MSWQRTSSIVDSHFEHFIQNSSSVSLSLCPYPTVTQLSHPALLTRLCPIQPFLPDSVSMLIETDAKSNMRQL
jgi:hypothetical protein